MDKTYSGFADGIFDRDNVHRFGRAKIFSDKYIDKACIYWHIMV